MVEKVKAADILTAQDATNGWISDKPEGIAVAADGRVLVVTDNDGLLDLASKDELFR